MEVWLLFTGRDEDLEGVFSSPDAALAYLRDAGSVETVSDEPCRYDSNYFGRCVIERVSVDRPFLDKLAAQQKQWAERERQEAEEQLQKAERALAVARERLAKATI